MLIKSESVNIFKFKLVKTAQKADCQNVDTSWCKTTPKPDASYTHRWPPRSNQKLATLADASWFVLQMVTMKWDYRLYRNYVFLLMLYIAVSLTLQYKLCFMISCGRRCQVCCDLFNIGNGLVCMDHVLEVPSTPLVR